MMLGLAALGVVTFVPLSASRVHTWPMAALVAVLWWVPLAALFDGIRRSDTWRTPPFLLFSGVALLSAGTVLAAWNSPYATLSLARVWPTLGGTALFLWLHHAWSAPARDAFDRRGAIVRILAGAGAALTIVSLVQWSRATWPLPWGTRNAAPFGHSTYTAGALVLAWPWMMLAMIQERGVRRLAWGAAGALALVALAATSSRGGVLGLGLAVASFAAGAVAWGRWPARTKLLIGAGALGLGVLVVLTNPRLRELVVHRQWGEGARESNVQRQAMLEAGRELGALRPLTGWGPGTVAAAYPLVRARLDGGTETIFQLHNTPVQVWATTGVFGLAGILLVVLGAAIASRRAVRTPFGAAAGASLLGYGVVALTDHQLDVPFIAAFAAASLAALSSSVAAPGRTPAPAWRVGVGLLLVALVVAPAPALLRDLQARSRYDAALEALGAGRTGDYVRDLERAAAALPADPFFLHQAAGALLGQAAAEGDPTRRQALLRQAVDRLERSLTTGVHTEYAHFNLGWLLLDLGEPRAAVRHFTGAARLVPDKGGVYFGLGLAWLAEGRRDAAVRAFALERLNDPRSATSPAWETAALAPLASDVRAEALRLLDRLRDSAAPLGHAAPWLRWWWDDDGARTPPAGGFSDESRTFAGALPKIERRDALDATRYPWARAYAAWRESDPAEKSRLFLVAAGGERPLAEALARRTALHPSDFRRFLAAPAGDEPALVLTLRRQRTGYGMLALHPEGPALADAYVVQENRATALAAGLFPAKGWLPGRFLLALLPDNP